MKDGYADWRLSIGFDRLEQIAGAYLTETHEFEDANNQIKDELAYAYYYGAANAIQSLMTRAQMPTALTAADLISSGLGVLRYRVGESK